MPVEHRFLLYAPVLMGATALLFAKSFVYARLFPVESFGALNQATLFASAFTNCAGAGLQLLGHKLLPQYYARGDQRSVENLLAGALTVYGSVTLLGGICFAVAIVSGALSGVASWGATLLLATAQYIFMLRLIDIKSELRFLDHAQLSSLRATLLLALGTLVAATTRSVAATLAVESVVTVGLAVPAFVGQRGVRILRQAFALRADRTWLAANLPAALRLLWLSGTLVLLYAIDRWSGIVLLNKRQYGIFALGLLVVVIFETLQTVVNVAAYPLMGRMIAHGEYRRAFRLATMITVLVIGLTAVCYLPFVLIMDFLVRGYLPAYAAATTVIKLTVVAGALRLADFYASFAVLCNQERRLAWLLGAVAVLVALILYGVSSFGHVSFDPERLAVVTVAVSACGFLVNFAVAARALRRYTVLAPA
jgi:O-antigen/teichoic acid export membrane protein